MTHQVLEVYNSLPTTQTTNGGATKLFKLLVYLLMVTFENGENCSIWCKIQNNGPMFDSIWNEKTQFTQFS